MRNWVNERNPIRDTYLKDAYFKVIHNMYDKEQQQIQGGTAVVTGGNACIENELNRLQLLGPTQILVHEIHEPVLAWYKLTNYIKRMSIKYTRKILLHERNILWSSNKCVNFISNDLQGREATNSRKYYEDMDLWATNQIATALTDNPNQVVGWLANMSVRNIGKEYLNDKLDKIVQRLEEIKVSPRVLINNLPCYNRTMYTVGGVFTTNRKHTARLHKQFCTALLEEFLNKEKHSAVCNQER